MPRQPNEGLGVVKRMPRPKKEGAAPPKTRSRNGCWPCKARKVKCGEEKPSCMNCQRQGETCDYSIRLIWDGRSKKNLDGKPGSQPMTFGAIEVVPTQAVQPNAPKGSKGHDSFPDPAAGLSVFASLEYTKQDVRSISQSPFERLGDRRGLLPPFSADSSSVACPRPDPFDVDHPRSPPPKDLASRVMEAAESMAILPQLRHFGHVTGNTSPTGFIPDRGTNIHFSSTISNVTRPPYSIPSSAEHIDHDSSSPERPAKRVRLSPWDDATHSRGDDKWHQAPSPSPVDMKDLPRPPFRPRTPGMISSQVKYPMTPASSSTASDEAYPSNRLGSISHTNQDGGTRRVSVSSLLSGSPGLEQTGTRTSNPTQAYTGPRATSPRSENGSPLRRRNRSHSQTKSYGLDQGLPDLDIPRNNDTAAINGISPSQQSDRDAWLENVDLGVPEFGFGLQRREFVFAKGGYYASSVAIKIPKELEPLPSTLLENPMNLLYFHHFLNHTARILVVHDCSQNPFRTVLPQMAIKHHNLLNLLLAYSASHRARLLTQPEPANRIAHWVQDVFPSLRHALDNAETSNIQVSDANLATAIMLTSLEIISPSAFGVSVPWQNHLNIARRIIRYGGNCLQPVSRSNTIPHFLHVWLAYIDVFGSLSSRTLEEPLFYATLDGIPRDTASTLSDDDDYIIECMLGFTSHCVPILAQIANLARLCANERDGSDAETIDYDWQPSQVTQRECDRLQIELENSRLHPVKLCPHYEYHSSSPISTTIPLTRPDEDSIAILESAATNDAFHRAALIHLLRRVRNLPRSAPAIQSAIQDIVDSLSKVRPGGSAEACLLFPMFTAGAEAEDEGTRELILERVKRLEGVGMMQVGRARMLMQKVWETGREWEVLAQGEFFG